MTGLEYFQDFVTNNILKINVLSNATAAMFLYIWPEQKNCGSYQLRATLKVIYLYL